MEYALINKKAVRKNPELKKAQKVSKKYYGRVRGKAPKLKLSKVVDITNIKFLDLTEGQETERIDNCFSIDSLIELCEKNQLTGRSGNGYPVAKKFEELAKKGQSQRVLLVNGVECDPGLVHDAWLYCNQIGKVRQGIKILQQCFNFKESYLATREPNQHVINQVNQVRVPNRYPCGYEKEVVRFVLGIELNENEYPINRGILVINLQTVVRIAELLQDMIQSDSRYLTVANMITGQATVVKADIGKSGADIAKTLYPDVATKNLFIGGGVLNCHQLKSGETIDQTTNFIGIGNLPEYEKAGKCRNCGGCSSKCPKGIKVHKVVQAIEKGNLSELKNYDVSKCIGCGACTYTCGAGKDVRSFVARAKTIEKC